MDECNIGEGMYGDAIGRWAGFGPYYAMFPMEFARATVKAYCPAGGSVLDPFAGRGTAVFAAAVEQRVGIGVEINPVGWLFGRVKLHPATDDHVLKRASEIAKVAKAIPRRVLDEQPEFFRWCYSQRVLRFLLAARDCLDWRNGIVDGTLMAILLNHLHGNRGRELSNQMRQAKALAPAYSVRWWRQRNMKAPDIEPIEFLRKKLNWRYSQGTVKLDSSRLYLGDSRKVLPRLRAQGIRFNLLLTSPPYIGVADYHYDQWLRLWMLGGPPEAMHASDATSRGDFENKVIYEEILRDVFKRAAPLLLPDAVIYVRTDARKTTLEITQRVLLETFSIKPRSIEQPVIGQTQTALFGDKERKPGEVDLIIHLADLSRKQGAHEEKFRTGFLMQSHMAML